MYFVGRIDEINKIIKALCQNRNIIVTGKYGIGRTSLVRQVAEKMQEKGDFIFADFSKNPSRVCSDILNQLSRKKRKDEYIKYKSIRFMIANMSPKDKRRCIIVLDNIAKLTAQKLALIRYLTFENRFRFVAITEVFLLERELFRLRAQLAPADIITLKHLSVKDTCELLQYYACKHAFHWTENHIRVLALSSGGYPLGAKEAVTRELKNLKHNSTKHTF